MSYTPLLNIPMPQTLLTSNGVVGFLKRAVSFSDLKAARPPG